MSMIGNFRRVTPEQLSDIIADPDLILELLEEDEADSFPADRCLDIDKAWHGIHFLLTGSAWERTPPLADAVLGGVEIGDDVGYGPAKYLTAEQVRETSAALATVSARELVARLDLQRMREEDIYPSGWTDETGECAYLGEYYGKLAAFYAEAARAGDAMIKYIN